MRSLRKISLLVAVTLSGVLTMAQQVPHGINYQAVARDSYGNELTSQQIDIRFTVLSGTPQGDIQYQEVHYEVSTSRYGVFSVIIGNGTPIMGLCESFSAISWESAPHYLMVEIKFDNEYLDMGTMQFLSVPYALYAGKSLEPGPEGPPGPKGDKGEPGDPASDDQTISFDGSNLSIADGNEVNLESLLQSLSLKGDTLSITRGNFVTFSKLDVDDADPDPTNEIQDLRLENDQLRITGNTDPSLIDLSNYLDNTDRQQLVFNEADSTITIDNGNSINLAGVLRDEDTDFDPDNELQSINIDNNVLTIENDPLSTQVDLEPYLDNTDNQQIEYDSINYDLSISNGNTVSIGSIIAFRSSMSSNFTLNNDVYQKVVFDNDSDPNNISNVNYNTTTGIFTAPTDGIYNITITTEFGFSNAHLKVVKNTSDYEKLLGPTSVAGTFNSSVTCKLNAGDEISIWIKQTNGFDLSSVPFSGTFSGFRIY